MPGVPDNLWMLPVFLLCALAIALAVRQYIRGGDE